MITYDQPKFLSYPRPERAIPPEAMGSFAERGYLAQYKRNGTATEIIVSPSRELFTFNRHGEAHKLWKWSEESAEPFRSIPGNGWWVFCAELLHSKVKGGPKDTHYLHDVLVADNKRLVGMRYVDRYDTLCARFGVTEALPQTDAHYVVQPKLWVAKNHISKARSFNNIFKGLQDDIDEGLVLKNPQAKLALTLDNSWTVKCRLPHKNYSW